MVHYISGIVGDPRPLIIFAESKHLHRPVNLPQNLAFLPLSDEHLDRIYPMQGEFDPKMSYLSENLSKDLRDMSREAKLAYIETEYFGGDGCQGAVVYENGEVIYGPMVAHDKVISHALRLLGLQKDESHRDEFDTAGFGKSR
jgi:hypothetical protein